MRRIATCLALCATTALLAGCGQHRHARHLLGPADARAAFQPPTRVQGALDSEIHLAEEQRPVLGDDAAPRSRVSDSIMLRGTATDSGYRDSLSPID